MHIYIYIYIYMCVCVCVSVCVRACARALIIKKICAKLSYENGILQVHAIVIFNNLFSRQIQRELLNMVRRKIFGKINFI